MEKKAIPFKKQIFVCTNDLCQEKPSCGDHAGLEVFQRLRSIAKERKLHPKYRVAQAKCLGFCGNGVTVMSYPDQTWLSDVRIDDIDELADMFLTDKN